MPLCPHRAGIFSITSRNFREDLWLAEQSPHESCTSRKGPSPEINDAAAIHLWKASKKISHSSIHMEILIQNHQSLATGAALLNTAQSPPSTTLSPLSTRGRWWTQVKGMKNVLQRYLGAGILSSEYVHFLISGSSAKGSSRFCAENAANEAWPGNQGSSVRNISTGGLRRWILFWGRMSKAQDETT